MKTKTLRAQIGRLICHGLLGLVAVGLAACSDGALPTPSSPLSISPPVINSFTVTKIGDVATSGSAVTVNAGDGVELAWSVGGADKVTLASESGSLAEHDVDAEGKETVSSIQSDEVYNLVAYNQGIASMASVRVSVAKKAEVRIIKFTADPAVIEPGQSTKLCFEVQPSDATVKITDAAGAEVPLAGSETKPDDVVPAETPDTEAPLLLAEGIAVSIASKSLNLLPPKVAEVAPETPATGEQPPVVSGGEEQPAPVVSKSGCTVDVTPADSTTYKLVATAVDGTSAEQSVPVTVEAKLDATLVAKDADGKEITAPIVSAQPVKATLEWVVTGSYDKIEIDQGVGDVASATVDGKGSKEMEVAATTTYTLKVSKGENEPVTKQVTITIEAPAAVTNVTLMASSTNVFAGEDVTLTVTTDVPSLPDGAKVAISGVGTKESFAAEGGITSGKFTSLVKPIGTITYQAEITIGTTVNKSNAVTIYVRGWEPVAAGVGTAVTVAKGTVYAGFEQKLQGGNLSIAKREDKAQTKSVSLPYVEPFKEAYISEINSDEFAKFNSYAVRGIAVNANDTKQIAVGAAGAVYLSTDGGDTFTMVEAIPYKKKGDGTHASCKGSTQKGRTGEVENGFAGVQQVCDVVFLPGGGLVLAYENGVLYSPNVGAKTGSRVWRGLKQGGKGGNSLSGILSHDLAYDEASKTIYVATDKGVFKIGEDTVGNEGAAFAEVGSLGKAAYAVAVAPDGKVYAGTKDGLHKYNGTQWESVKSLGGVVYSIEVDPVSSDTLYLGTGTGFVVGRLVPPAMAIDATGAMANVAGETNPVAWFAESFGGGADTPVAVRAVAVDGGDIYTATSKGVYVSRGAQVMNSTPQEKLPVAE